MSDRPVKVLLDASAITAFTRGSIDVGEVIAEVDDELGAVEELLGDFMSLVAIFAGRMYGIRSGEAKRRLLAAAGEDVG